jgi:hypothetical protein
MQAMIDGRYGGTTRCAKHLRLPWPTVSQAAAGRPVSGKVREALEAEFAAPMQLLTRYVLDVLSEYVVAEAGEGPRT